MDAGGLSQSRNRRSAMLPVVLALGIVALSSALLYLQEAGSLGRGGGQGSNAACAVWDDKVVPLDEQMAHLDQQLAALTESIRAHQQALLDREQVPSAATDADGAGSGADVAFGDADLARPARRVALDLVEIIGKTHLDAPRLKELIEPMAKRVGKWVQDKVQDACQPCRPCNSTIVLVGKPCRVNAFPTTCQRRLSPAEVDDEEDLEGPSDDRVEGEGGARRRSLLGWSGDDLEGPSDDRVDGEGGEVVGTGRRNLLGWSGEDLEEASDDRVEGEGGQVVGEGAGRRSLLGWSGEDLEGESVCNRVSPLHAILAAESVGERRRVVREQEESERKRPLCRDGTAPGYWKDLQHVGAVRLPLQVCSWYRCAATTGLTGSGLTGGSRDIATVPGTGRSTARGSLMPAATLLALHSWRYTPGALGDSVLSAVRSGSVVLHCKKKCLHSCRGAGKDGSAE
ncbi:unnamed protein product [Closterium sp. NIES-53]